MEVDPDMYINPKNLIYKYNGKLSMGNNYKTPVRNRKYSWMYDFPNNYGAKFLLEDFKNTILTITLPIELVCLTFQI